MTWVCVTGASIDCAHLWFGKPLIKQDNNEKQRRSVTD